MAERTAHVGLDVLENRIGYQFKNRDLLLEALTHPSFETSSFNYERLEFLGDAVIELFVSEFLFKNCPDLEEGTLTRIRAAVVCDKSLSLIATHLDLGAFLVLGRGEEVTRGRLKKSILENAMEALMGAVFLDGGHEKAWKVMNGLFRERCLEVMDSLETLRDYKSQLQELVQGTIKKEIKYVMTQMEGPPHQPTFHVQLTIGGERICTGVGSSKKEAAQHAAQYALEHQEKFMGMLRKG